MAARGGSRGQRCDLSVPASQLNDLLVLLSVLMIEAGGGLSLSLAMALQSPPVGRGTPPASQVVSHSLSRLRCSQQPSLGRPWNTGIPIVHHDHPTFT
jgi:hypothetical protein